MMFDKKGIREKQQGNRLRMVEAAALFLCR